MGEGALVEGVDLELEAVEPELVEQVELEQARSLVGDPAAAKVGVNRQPAEVGDAAALVGACEAHRPGSLSVGLDDEHAERVGVGLAALDAREDRLEILRAR